MKLNIRKEIQAISNEIIDYRRDFHKYPELSFKERKEILESIVYVSSVIPSNWIIDEKFMKKNKIDYLVHGSDCSNHVTIKKKIIFKRTKNISSNAIRKKIINNFSKKKSNNFNLVIKRVLLKDLNVKSPYNTYTNYGLPPGPITMPDLNVIDAVLNAEKHNYLYFVVNPEKPGYHRFAKSLREHNSNRKKYTQWLNRKRVYR